MTPIKTLRYGAYNKLKSKVIEKLESFVVGIFEIWILNFETYPWESSKRNWKCKREFFKEKKAKNQWNLSNQGVHSLTVLDLQIPCFRPETPAMHLTNHEGRGRKLRRPRRL